MMRRTLMLVFVTCALKEGAVAQTASQFSVPSDSEIRQSLVERIDNYHRSVGIVISGIGPTDRRVISYGSLGKGDTAFEIGSATKVFTSVLLAAIVQWGQTGRAYFSDDNPDHIF